MRWICKRCDIVFDPELQKCECETSPSPWEPVGDDPIIDLILSMSTDYKLGKITRDTCLSNLKLMIKHIEEL